MDISSKKYWICILIWKWKKLYSFQQVHIFGKTGSKFQDELIIVKSYYGQNSRSISVVQDLYHEFNWMDISRCYFQSIHCPLMIKILLIIVDYVHQLITSYSKSVDSFSIVLEKNQWKMISQPYS